MELCDLATDVYRVTHPLDSHILLQSSCKFLGCMGSSLAAVAGNMPGDLPKLMSTERRNQRDDGSPCMYIIFGEISTWVAMPFLTSIRAL